MRPLLCIVVLVLLASVAQAADGTQKLQLEVGVTPTTAKAVDDTLNTIISKVPGAERVIGDMGNRAGQLIMMYYAQDVKRIYVGGLMLTIVGGVFLLVALGCAWAAIFTGSDTWPVAAVALVLMLPFVSRGVVLMSSPGFYAMNDTVQMLIKVITKNPW